MKYSFLQRLKKVGLHCFSKITERVRKRKYKVQRMQARKRYSSISKLNLVYNDSKEKLYW